MVVGEGGGGGHFRLPFAAFPFNSSTSNNKYLSFCPLFRARGEGWVNNIQGWKGALADPPRRHYRGQSTGIIGCIVAAGPPTARHFRRECSTVEERESQQITPISWKPRAQKGGRVGGWFGGQRGERHGAEEASSTPVEDARTFLIYERAYFLGLLHMDIGGETPRGCEKRPSAPCGTLMVPSRPSFRLDGRSSPRSPFSVESHPRRPRTSAPHRGSGLATRSRGYAMCSSEGLPCNSAGSSCSLL